MPLPWRAASAVLLCYADPECEMVVKPAVWTNETAKKEILKLHSDNQKYLPAGKKAGRLLAPPKKEQEEYLSLIHI